MTTATLHPMDQAGRRVEFAFRSDPDRHLPGVITGIDTTQHKPVLKVRLDGTRSNLHVQADYDGLRYLDSLGPVPELPMGRFRPTAADLAGAWAGVPVCQFEDEDVIVLTADRGAALRAITAYCTDMDWDMEFESLDCLVARWVVFEWQPEDAEGPWLMYFAAEGDDMALQIHYLPA